MLQLFEFELNKYPLNAPSESRYRGGMENTKPGTGTDYPRTFEEMDEWFRTEAGCRACIRRLRWPGGFVCGCCGVTGEPWVMARGIFRCKACHGNTPLTAGTVPQDTRKPLRTWFLAMWFTTSQKNGAGALGLPRALGLGSFDTAWTWMHKLRRAMVRPDRDRLLLARSRPAKPALEALKRAMSRLMLKSAKRA